jgi:hypothetical protein
VGLQLWISTLDPAPKAQTRFGFDGAPKAPRKVLVLMNYFPITVKVTREQQVPVSMGTPMARAKPKSSQVSTFMLGNDADGTNRRKVR